jgi:histidinol-phosphate/aromatic aminotransferase/cobyric acid decarboxylase-like protein
VREDASNCFHGGAFFNAIGTEFDRLQSKNHVINADVLDAWFDPSPKVVAALREHLPWLLKTSPPTWCDGLIRVISRTRGVPEECILPGAGSSDLIFRAFRQWLAADSRVLILDPTYGEYSHVFERIVGCRVVRLQLRREQRYEIDPGELIRRCNESFDLIVLVNPNSPTGRLLPAKTLKAILSRATARRVWVDETYIEYAGVGQSIEQFAAASPNVVVCKSMSKVYALSGVRAAYLCGPAALLEELRPTTPPWAVSLPAQVCAVAALQDPDYYSARYAETHRLRTELQKELTSLPGWKVISGIANFLLCHLPAAGPSASAVVARCREHGLFLRDASAMGRSLGAHALRIAVKDAETNRRMIEILRTILPAAPREISARL